MKTLRYCRSCSGPRPRAAHRCPWCHTSYDAEHVAKPEHLFAPPEPVGSRDRREEVR